MTHQRGLRLPPPVLGEELPYDLGRILAGRLLVTASSGGGKSWMLRYLLEGLAPRIPCLVVDWEGEFPSLKDVWPFVHVGVSGQDPAPDLGTDEDAARGHARAIAARGASAVLDLSELPDPESKRRLAAAWLDSLMRLPRHERRATIVVIDEAHELAPQAGDVESSHAVKALVSRGRKRGLGAILATQRLSRLSKDVSEAQNRLYGRTVLDVDVRRTAEDLGMDRARAQELKALEPGEFVAAGPAFGDGTGAPVHCRSGAVRSLHPEAGGIEAPLGGASVAELVAALVGEAAIAARDDAAALRRRIESLEADLAAARIPDPEAVRAEAERLAAPLRAEVLDLTLRIEAARHHARAILLGEREIPPQGSEETPTEGDHAPRPVGTVRERIEAALGEPGTVHATTDLAEAAATSARSSTFRQALADLATGGLIDRPRPGEIRVLGGAG